jgi:hypothetical protein
MKTEAFLTLYKSSMLVFWEERRVDLYVDANVSEEYNASIIRTEEQYIPPKRWYLPASPHGVTTQKDNIEIFAAVRTSNLTAQAMFD